MTRSDSRPMAIAARFILGWATVAALLAGPALADHIGYVDGSELIAIAGGDDAVTVEVHLSGTILRALARVDEDLYDLVSGVDSINAIILTLDDEGPWARARGVIRDKGTKLQKKGWERIAVVREADSEIQVLVLTRQEKIQGLVVMVVEAEDGEVVFANLAGTIDLEKIQRIGQEYNVPGLKDVNPIK